MIGWKNKCAERCLIEKYNVVSYDPPRNTSLPAPLRPCMIEQDEQEFGEKKSWILFEALQIGALNISMI